MSDLPIGVTTTIPALPHGWYLVGFSVLAGGRLAVLGASEDVRRAWHTDRFQHTVGETLRLAANATAKVWIVQDDELCAAAQFPLLADFPMFEQFADGQWLVVNSRSRAERDARVLRADGVEERRIELGDGIQHAKIDDQNRIWVGWFDEGVFGNDVWRVPGLKWPPSANGIAAFDETGALIRHAQLESIADCYALNVFDDEAWACTYTDFPILRMADGQQQVWSTDLSGTRAIAVAPPYVVAAGGYREMANRVVLLRLDGDRAKTVAEWRLPFEVGYPADVELIDGRADELHVVRDGEWRRWRVSDFVAATA